MSKDAIRWLGFAAGALTTLAFLPQLMRVYRRKSAKDLSYGYLFVFTGGVILWLAYGILLRDGPLIIANAVTLALVLGILVMKMAYGKG